MSVGQPKQPSFLGFDGKLSIPERRVYSTILRDFSWQSHQMVSENTSFSSDLPYAPDFNKFLLAMDKYEESVFSFERVFEHQDDRQLLGIVVVPRPPSSFYLLSNHHPKLSRVRFQRLCSIICAYRLREIICFQNPDYPRIRSNIPRPLKMYLPPPDCRVSKLPLVERLRNWPELVRNFKQIALRYNCALPPQPAFDHPIANLISLLSSTRTDSAFLAIQDNFLSASLAVSAMATISFLPGTLPDLPSTIPHVPAGGLKTREQLDQFRRDYNAFISTCTDAEHDGAGVSSATHRAAFQLAVFISPLYLLIAVQLGVRSFHRGEVLESALELGSFRPDLLDKIEIRIWKTVFQLARGDVSPQKLLYNLALDLVKIIEEYANESIDSCILDDSDFFARLSGGETLCNSSNKPSPASAPFAPASSSASMNVHSDILPTLPPHFPPAIMDRPFYPSLAIPSLHGRINALHAQLPSFLSNLQFTAKPLPGNFSIPHGHGSQRLLEYNGSESTFQQHQGDANVPIIQHVRAHFDSQMNADVSFPPNSVTISLLPHSGNANTTHPNFSGLRDRHGVYHYPGPLPREDNIANSTNNPHAESSTSAAIQHGLSDAFYSPTRYNHSADDDESSDSEDESSNVFAQQLAGILDQTPTMVRPMAPSTNPHPPSVSRSPPVDASITHHGSGDDFGETLFDLGVPSSLLPMTPQPSPISGSPPPSPAFNSLPSWNMPSRNPSLSCPPTPQYTPSHIDELCVDPKLVSGPTSPSSDVMHTPRAPAYDDVEMDVDVQAEGGEFSDTDTIAGSQVTSKQSSAPLFPDHVSRTPTRIDLDSLEDVPASPLSPLPSQYVNPRSPSLSVPGDHDPPATTRKKKPSEPIIIDIDALPLNLKQKTILKPGYPNVHSSHNPKWAGTAKNPINVDDVMSLFEPVSNRVHIKVEEISLPPEVVPPVLGETTFTVYSADGEAVSFTPSFHFDIYHTRFNQFMERIEQFYQDGRPLHLVSPAQSIIKTFTFEAWSALSSVEQQHEISRKNIVVTGWQPRESHAFDEHGIRAVAGIPSRQISINDYSIEPTEETGCRATTVSGRVSDLLANQPSNLKILNALDLPDPCGSKVPLAHTTDLHAWALTAGHHCVDQVAPYPTEHMRWSLIGHQNTITFLHIDCEGVGTDVMVLAGGKIWIFLHPRPSNPVSSINFFIQNGFRLDEVLNSSNYDFEAVALLPGHKLFMLPCQPHLVYGYADTICRGGHYYFTGHLPQILPGMVHAFILHSFLTNTTHPTLPMLQRMVLLYHMSLLERLIDDKDPAFSHIPDVDTSEGILQLITACTLVILSNVLDFRTYRAPNQEQNVEANEIQKLLIEHDMNTIPYNERLAICYARGIALRLFQWVRECAVIKNPKGDPVDFPSLFLVQIARSLLNYKKKADDAASLDLQSNCTLPFLTAQVSNVIRLDTNFASLWRKPSSTPHDSLVLADWKQYSVQWVHETRFNSMPSQQDDYFIGLGTTQLDNMYFSFQKSRRDLEMTHIVPHLTTPPSSTSSTSTRPLKRGRVD